MRCSISVRPPRVRRLLPGVVVSLLLGTSPVQAQTISGRLMEVESGLPVPLGLILLLTEAGDSVGRTLTDRDGRFSISSAEPGSFTLSASALGYRDTRVGVFELGVGGEMTIEFRVVADPIPIEELVVSFNRPILQHALVRNGFVERYALGFGRFITPYDIENSVARSTPDLFRGMQGVVVQGRTLRGDRLGGALGGFIHYTGDEILMRVGTGVCRPSIYLDGIRMANNDLTSIDAIAPIYAIEAAEVYRRAAEIPVQYSASTSPESSACGVIVFWTKLGLAAGQRPTDWGYVDGSQAGRLPTVHQQGPPPVAGETVRMELDGETAGTVGLASPWEGTFMMVREGNIIATDPAFGRAVVLPLSGVGVLQVRRERSASHAIVRGALAGTAMGLGTMGGLALLCEWSNCDASLQTYLQNYWLPAAITGVFVGILVKNRGPGSHWVQAAVPELEGGARGAALSWRLPVRSP